MKEYLIRKQIKNLAISKWHLPYLYGGHGKNTYDCAGLAWDVYHNIFGIDIYEKGFGLSTTTMILTSPIGKLTYFEESSNEKNLSLIKKGEILLFHTQSLKSNLPFDNNKYPGHVGIYIGDNKFIHASKRAKKVIISKIEEGSHYYKKLIGFKNYF